MVTFVPRGSYATNEAVFEGHTIILPTPSVGNVAQLTLDLYLSTLLARQKLERVGYFDDDRVTPFVAPDPFGDEGSNLATSLEVYLCKETKVVLLQQRGPIAKNKNACFAKDLVEWIVQRKFSQVLIVSSADAAFRIDPQFDGLQSRFIASPSLKDALVKAEWQPLENEFLTEQLESIVRKGSYLQCLLSELETKPLTYAALIQFCSEGDNIPDAVETASTIENYIHLISPPTQNDGMYRWRMPAAWKNLFGSPVSMYPTIF
eukprot:TRINITY_DN569_c1_g1_i2.p1 TRINITY_DN569_c1_g1~~TRINITY_DN569_c1_g1_i2.p1  ORF type:complete len:262 (-),score=64.14 TRINITY_DN569_c1_g1_i2:112-897(-)